MAEEFEALKRRAEMDTPTLDSLLGCVPQHATPEPTGVAS
jgi:hypothetical protein